MTTKHAHMFVKNGRTVMPARDRGNELALMPAGIYQVKFNPEVGFFLTEQEPLQLPSKTYGETSDRADMILHTFQTRIGVNTGILLTGNKGSGKTMLTKTVCMKAVEELGFPVLLIDDAFVGTSFNEFMNSIVQPCVVLIDEFEKKYKREEEQNGLLSLLDGTGVNNKLFMLTSNSEKVSEFLISRPSRLFYHWRYGKLEEAVLEGYCTDNLVDKKHVENMKTLWGVSSDMSFDVMQALVEELNRYPGRDFVDLICNMNISLGDALSRRFMLDSVLLGDEALPLYSGGSTTINMVTFQEGTTRLNASVSVPSWDTQKILWAKLGQSNAYFYNKDLLEKEEKGEISAEDIQNSMDEEFCLNLKYVVGTDRINSEAIVFNRDIGGRPLVVTFKLQKEDTALTYFRRLFK